MSVERAHLLAAEDFPMQIEVVRSDTKAFVWGVTVLKPRSGRLAELYVPPCSEWVGVPVYVVMTDGQGQRTMTGPHDMLP